MSALRGKRIVLGITGSIAAYKAAVLARLLIKSGAEVQVVITPSGKEFITPITLSTLTKKPVISEFFSGRDGTWNSHVDLGLWADAMLIAPATASTIGKMAYGIADNMLITTYLSMKAPVFVAPAMDLDMYKHATTTENLIRLRERGNIIIDAEDGFLASELVGKGRMQEPEVIVQQLETYFEQGELLRGKKILVTAGPTHEAIDPVRYIGNHSTGRMGIEIADLCASWGGEVTLVLGPTGLEPKSPNIQVLRVTTAEEMLQAVSEPIDATDWGIFSAAVADYRPRVVSEEKLKRERASTVMLELERNPDIAALMGARKKGGQLFVCFALETSSGEGEAIRKMKTKNMDVCVLNSLQHEGAGFGHLTNRISIYSERGTPHHSTLKSKAEIAKDIVEYLLHYA